MHLLVCKVTAITQAAEGISAVNKTIILLLLFTLKEMLLGTSSHTHIFTRNLANMHF